MPCWAPESQIQDILAAPSVTEADSYRKVQMYAGLIGRITLSNSCSVQSVVAVLGFHLRICDNTRENSLSRDLSKLHFFNDIPTRRNSSKMPLKPAVSTLARNTIKTAYDELDRTISPGDKRDFPHTTLQNVQEAALKIENQLAARQSLRNMRRLMPLFRGLEHYSKVVDVLCNGTPFLHGSGRQSLLSSEWPPSLWKRLRRSLKDMPALLNR
jgi:hypothetical protein